MAERLCVACFRRLSWLAPKLFQAPNRTARHYSMLSHHRNTFLRGKLPRKQPSDSSRLQPLHSNVHPKTPELQKRSRRHIHAVPSLKEQNSAGPVVQDSSSIDEFYADLLRQPLPGSAATQRPIAQPPSSPSHTTSPPPESISPQGKARIVFGSRLAGPARRKTELDAARASGKGEWVAGRWIPPRPSEPDNCCMSGCVNCVWELYRDDLEDWVRTKREALAQDASKKGRKYPRREVMATEGGVQGDEDGLGSRAMDTERMEVEGLMGDVPVGIREFINTEQRLRRRKQAAGQAL